MLRTGFHKAYIDGACVFHSHRYTPEQHYNVSVAEGALFARHFGWNMHPNPQTIEAEIEGMNVRDTQYAVANKIPFKQLKQQKQLNKATIEGRTHGAATHERSSATRTSLHLCAPSELGLCHDNCLDYRHGSEDTGLNKEQGMRAQSQHEIVPDRIMVKHAITHEARGQVAGRSCRAS